MEECEYCGREFPNEEEVNAHGPLCGKRPVVKVPPKVDPGDGAVAEAVNRRLSELSDELSQMADRIESLENELASTPGYGGSPVTGD